MHGGKIEFSGAGHTLLIRAKAQTNLLRAAVVTVVTLTPVATAFAVPLTASDPTTLNAAIATIDGNPNTSYQLTISTPISLSGLEAISTNNTVTITAANSGLQGTGGLSQSGTGILVLSAPTTYTGATNILGGTLQAGQANALSTGTSVYVATGATFDINNFNQSIGSLTGAGTILLENANLVIGNDNTNTTFSATVHGNVGNGYLIKVGTGTMTLSSASMDSGEFHISQGTVVQSAGASVIRYTAIGSGAGANATMVMSGGTYSVNNAIQVGDYSGTGVLDQTGGVISLTGSLNVGNQGGNGTYNMMGGTLTLVSGLYDVGRNTAANPSSTGTINLSGGLIDVQGGNFILGNRSNPGVGAQSKGLMVQTGGTLRIEAAASLFLSAYGNGEYDLNGGTLQIGGSTLVANYAGSGAYTLKLGGGTLQSYGLALNSTLNATLTQGTVSTLDSNGLGMTWSGNLSGTGGLAKAGLGTLVLAGTNDYTGGTTVEAGTLQLGGANALPTGQALTLAGGTLDLNGHSVTLGSLSGSSGGTLLLGSAAVTTGADNSSTSFAGVFSGSGSVTKVGSGTLELSGSSNAYSGTLTLSGGGIAFASGVLGGSLIQASGTTVSGSGTILGAYTQASGGSLQVQASPAGASSLTIGGIATIAGGLSVAASNGAYPTTSTYTILTAAGGVDGKFSSVTSNLSYLSPSLVYEPDAVELILTRETTTLGIIASTPNQRSIAGVLDGLSAQNLPTFNSFFTAVLGQTTAQSAVTLDHVGSNVQIASAATGASIIAGQQFASTMLRAPGVTAGGSQAALSNPARVQFASTDPLDVEAQLRAGATSVSPSPWGAWAEGSGISGSLTGDGNAAGTSYSIGGGAVGADYRFNPGLLIGVSLGYAQSQSSLHLIGGSSSVESTSIGVYGGYRSAAFYATASIGEVYNAEALKRQIVVPGFAATNASATSNAVQFVGAAEFGYDLTLTDALTITPIAGVVATTISQKAYLEAGAGILDLGVGSNSTDSVRTRIGTRASRSFELGDQGTLFLAAKAAWSHEIGADRRTVSAQFASAPASAFVIDGAQPARDAALVAVEAALPVSDKVRLFVRYDGQLSQRDTAHGVTGGVSFAW